MIQTTPIEPEADALDQATQRMADVLLATLTQEAGRAHAQEGFDTDDLVGITLTALTAVTVQFAGAFRINMDQLVAAFAKAAGEETSNRARLN